MLSISYLLCSVSSVLRWHPCTCVPGTMQYMHVKLCLLRVESLLIFSCFKIGVKSVQWFDLGNHALD